MTTAYSPHMEPRALTVPASAAPYRALRTLELDEEAKTIAQGREKTVHAGEQRSFSVPHILLTAASLGSAMFLLGTWGNGFLGTALVIQLAVLALSLRATGRVVALLAARAGSAAYFRVSSTDRHINTTDVAYFLAPALLGLMQLGLVPAAQGIAAGAVVAAALLAQRISVVALRRVLAARESRAIREELAVS